jgi:S1-C subfamily serine protease
MLAKRLSSLILLLILTSSGPGVMAQRPAPAPKDPPVKAAPSPPDRASQAPQVVTVIHRLNGLQMFRLLLRSEQQVNAISGFEPGFSLFEEVHTNVIAGLALEDGETIAAWLPEADVEFGEWDWQFPNANNAPAVAAERTARESATRQTLLFDQGFIPEPDLTVIGADGKRLPAKYIGLDGATGLSILKLSKKDAGVVQPAAQGQVSIGQSVRLLGPEPAKTAPSLTQQLYVRVGAIPAEIRIVMRGPSGVISRLKVRSPKLSQANIGGVVVNEEGSTVGIVDAIEGNEASILPTELIQLAATRVLEQKRSVPRPWLGVRGEAMSDLTVDRLLNHGWEPQRARALASEHKGIVLTSITPGSPAAEAALREGDVILKINDRNVANPDDFTWFLEQMGPNRSLSFTLARPDRVTEELINVELKRRAPVRAINLKSRSSLAAQGIETIELRSPLAVKMGAARASLLVVFVQPSSPAFTAGLQPGDLIEEINGKPALAIAPLAPVSGNKISLSVVRQMQRVELTLENPGKKN